MADLAWMDRISPQARTALDQALVVEAAGRTACWNILVGLGWAPEQQGPPPLIIGTPRQPLARITDARRPQLLRHSRAVATAVLQIARDLRCARATLTEALPTRDLSLIPVDQLFLRPDDLEEVADLLMDWADASDDTTANAHLRCALLVSTSYLQELELNSAIAAVLEHFPPYDATPDTSNLV